MWTEIAHLAQHYGFATQKIEKLAEMDNATEGHLTPMPAIATSAQQQLRSHTRRAADTGTHVVLAR